MPVDGFLKKNFLTGVILKFYQISPKNNLFSTFSGKFFTKKNWKIIIFR